MKETIAYNILCATDDNYVPYCGIMLTSLFENNKEAEINVYILTENLNDTNKEKIKQLSQTYQKRIEIITVDSEKLKDCPIQRDDYVSIATYYRLLAPVLLPQEIEKILYLDCDMIVNGNIDALYNTDIEDIAVGSVLDEDYLNETKYKRLEYPQTNHYFNAGMLLINLSYWRRMDVMQRCLNYIKDKKDILTFHDQDTLNYILRNEKRELHTRYNLQTGFLYKSRKLEQHVIEEINEAIYKPIIIHYTGLNKPWFHNSTHPYADAYLHYKSISLWKSDKHIIHNRNKANLKEIILNIAYKLKIKKKYYNFIIERQNR